MAISVLRVMKSDDKHIEVLGEFWDAELAQRFADVMKEDDEKDGKDGEFDYVVESPHPTVSDD